MFPIIATTYSNTKCIPLFSAGPNASLSPIGIAPLNSTNGTIETKNTTKYLTNIFFPPNSINKNYFTILYFFCLY